MPAKLPLVFAALAFALSMAGGVNAQETLTMPRKLPQGPGAASETPLKEECSSAAAPRSNRTPRIRVVVPEPEIVFRYKSQPCQPGTPPGGPVAADTGRVDFNMTLNMPMGGGSLGLLPLLSALQSGGGLSSGLGNSGPDAQLLRAMLASRVPGATLDNNAGASGNAALNNGAASQAEVQAAMVKLASAIHDLGAKLDNEMVQMNTKLVSPLKELNDQGKDLDQLKKDLQQLATQLSKIEAAQKGKDGKSNP